MMDDTLKHVLETIFEETDDDGPLHQAIEEAEVKDLNDLQFVEEDDANKLPLKFVAKKKLGTFLRWIL